MKNFSPKIIFKQIPLEQELAMFFEFLVNDSSFLSKMIVSKYPNLLNVSDLIIEKDKKELIKKEILKIRIELGDKLDENLKKIESDWRKIEEDILNILSEIIQTQWPDKEIAAYISLNPVCPRHLDSCSFSITHDRNNTNLVITHEISHFIFFKKFKEIFPEISVNKYESPHREWLLSELVAVILSKDPRILKIVGVEDNFYPDHKKLILDGELITEMIQRHYNEYVVKENDFAKFIKKGIELVNKL